MLRFLTISALLALFSASPVLAAEHTVRFVGNGFFPNLNYVAPNDTIRFVNGTRYSSYISFLGRSYELRSNASRTFDLRGYSGTLTAQGRSGRRWSGNTARILIGQDAPVWSNRRVPD